MRGASGLILTGLKTDRCKFVIKYGLSFVLAEGTVDSILDAIDPNDKTMRHLDAITSNVYLLLDAAHNSALLQLKDAYTAVAANNNIEALKLFRSMGENALTGFQHSKTVDGWVQCTQLQVMDICYQEKP
jgi:hypothetical protein